MSVPTHNVVNLWIDQQLGHRSLAGQRGVIDHRINTLRDSVKHSIKPWKSRPVGASSLNFDNAENRFLLCGSCIGDVSIVDMESPSLENASMPVRHDTYRAPQSERHRYLVSASQFYPIDSGMFCTASMDQQVRLWDSNCMRVIDKYKNESAVVGMHWGMPSNGSSTSSSVIAVALGAACVRLVDPRTRNHIHHLRWPTKSVKCLRWFSTPSNLLVAGSESGDMMVWDVRSGRSELAEFQRHNEPADVTIKGRRARVSRAHDSTVTSIRCSSDGRWIVSLSIDGRLNVWSAQTLALEHSCNLRSVVDIYNLCTTPAEIGDEGNELFGFVGVGTSVVVARLTPPNARRPPATSRKKRQVVIKEEEAANGDIKKSSDIKEEQDKKPPLVTARRRGPLRAARLPPTTRGSEEHRVIRGHMQVVMSLAYRSNFQQLVSSSGDGSTLLWSPAADETLTEEKQQALERLYADAFSDDED